MTITKACGPGPNSQPSSPYLYLCLYNSLPAYPNQEVSTHLKLAGVQEVWTWCAAGPQGVILLKLWSLADHCMVYGSRITTWTGGHRGGTWGPLQGMYEFNDVYILRHCHRCTSVVVLAACSYIGANKSHLTEVCFELWKWLILGLKMKYM